MSYNIRGTIDKPTLIASEKSKLIEMKVRVRYTDEMWEFLGMFAGENIGITFEGAQQMEFDEDDGPDLEETE